MTFLKHKSGSVDSLLKTLSPPPLSFQQMLLGTMFKDFSKPGCCFICFNNLPSSAAILNSVWASSISEANSYWPLGFPSLYTGPLVYYHLLHYELSSLCIPCALSTLRAYVEFIRGFPGGSVIKNLPGGAGDTGDLGLIPGQEDPLEEEMATCSRILARKIPWTEESRIYRLQTSLNALSYMLIYVSR